MDGLFSLASLQLTSLELVSLIIGSVLLSLFNLLIIKLFSEDEDISRRMFLTITVLTTTCVMMSFTFSSRIIADIIFSSLLIITGGIDYLTKTIVVGLVGIGGVFSAGASLLYLHSPLDLLAGGLFGFAFYLAIYALAKIYYKKEAFGYGDVVFMGAIGLYLGFWHTVLAGLLTFYIALFFIIIFKIIGKLLSRHTEIAFAPYMAISAWIVSLFGNQLVKLYFDSFMN